MTIQSLIDWFSENPYLILGYFIITLVLSLLITSITKNENVHKIKYVLSVLVYAVTIPGILSAILILYSLFILQTNLLNLSIVAYFVPLMAMIITLIIINKKVKMSYIPGFDRLSGLMIIISIAFIIIFVLQRTYFGVLFIGGTAQLLIVFVLLLFILRKAWSRFIR